MNSGFIAQPPQRKPWLSAAAQLFPSFWQIIRHVFVPFKSQPEGIENLAEITGSLTDDKQLDQCQKIYEQVEASHVFLEEKARSMFVLVAFLAPFLASVFVFLLDQPVTESTSRTISVSLATVSSILLFLGGISIVRAISVKERQTLFLGSVINLVDKKFLTYNRDFYARGLLHCASMNQAMNAHIAQFVKGAHILTALAVFVFVGAVIPAAIAVPSTPTKVELVGSVNIDSAELVKLQKQVTDLGKSLAVLADSKPDADLLRQLQERTKQIEGDLLELKTTVMEIGNISETLTDPLIPGS